MASKSSKSSRLSRLSRSGAADPALVGAVVQGLVVGDEALVLKDAHDLKFHLGHRNVHAVLLSDVRVADAGEQIGDGVHDYLTRKIF